MKDRAFVSPAITAQTASRPNGIYGYDRTSDRMFVQSDPIGIKGGINTYTYVTGNPLRYVDALGLQSSTTSQTSSGRRDACVAACTVAGGVAVGYLGYVGGGILGGTGGGIGGTFVLPGPGTVGGVAVGAAAGSSAGGYGGSVLGSALGYGLGQLICSSDKSCEEIWDEEHRACQKWAGFGMRWIRACEDRANNRLRLCKGNGGTMPPDAPEPWRPDSGEWGRK